MRSLIDGLHARGLRVLLWWPMWAHGAHQLPLDPAEAPDTSRGSFVDPTGPSFSASMAGTMRRLLGAGPADLNADGLKLDWSYDISTDLQNPSLGWGDAALYRYLSVMDRSAHDVRADALIEASAAAPQFARVTDAVRLYDAWSEAEWSTRARIVTSSSPTALLEGDGWNVPSREALLHTVRSAVYGIPTMYFGSLWGDHQPVTASEARQLGTVLALTRNRGPGQARMLDNGEWSWTSRDGVTAQTFNGGYDLVVWDGTGRSGQAIATRAGPAFLPLPENGPAKVTDPAGRVVPSAAARHSVRLTLATGVTYRISIAGSHAVGLAPYEDRTGVKFVQDRAGVAA
jgi:hypothetical protein